MNADQKAALLFALECIAENADWRYAALEHYRKVDSPQPLVQPARGEDGFGSTDTQRAATPGRHEKPETPK